MGKESLAYQKMRKQQVVDCLRTRYATVAQVARDKIQEKLQSQRYELIILLGLRKGITLQNNVSSGVLIQRIKPDGILVLENGNEVDPLTL